MTEYLLEPPQTRGARRNDNDPFLELRLKWETIVPHWLRSGPGFAYAHFKMHRGAKWLSIDATESGEKSSKRVMLTLDENQVNALRKLLNDHALPFSVTDEEAEPITVLGRFATEQEASEWIGSQSDKAKVLRGGYGLNNGLES